MVLQKAADLRKQVCAGMFRHNVPVDRLIVLPGTVNIAGSAVSHIFIFIAKGSVIVALLILPP
jgi:hypothetical protein